MSSEEILNNLYDYVDISECISLLNFISKIPKNHKPCYNSKTTVSKSGWLVTMRRRWYNEKGENGILYVTKILNRCDNHYRMCYDIESKDIKNLTTALRNSVIGFDNLIETYGDQGSMADDYTKCKERVIILCNNNNNNNNNLSDRENENKEDNENETELIPMVIPDNPIKSNFFSMNNITFMISKK